MECDFHMRRTCPAHQTSPPASSSSWALLRTHDHPSRKRCLFRSGPGEECHSDRTYCRENPIARRSDSVDWTQPGRQRECRRERRVRTWQNVERRRTTAVQCLDVAGLCRKAHRHGRPRLPPHMPWVERAGSYLCLVVMGTANVVRNQWCSGAIRTAKGVTVPRAWSCSYLDATGNLIVAVECCPFGSNESWRQCLDGRGALADETRIPWAPATSSVGEEGVVC